MTAPDRSGESSRIIRKGDVEAEMGLLQRAVSQPKNQDFSGSLAASNYSLREVKDLGRDVPVSGAAIAAGTRRAGIRRQYIGKPTTLSEE